MNTVRHILFTCSASTVTSPQTVRAMVSGLLHPDWAFFFETDASGLGYLLLETVCIALAGTCLGVVLAVPLSFLGTARLVPKPIALLFRVAVMLIRSVPFLIYGLIFIRVTYGLCCVAACISGFFIEGGYCR